MSSFFNEFIKDTYQRVVQITPEGVLLNGTGDTLNVNVLSLSAGTFVSGSTNLYSIFSTSDTNTITNVQGNGNVFTGGTAITPVIKIVDSPSFNNLILSGTGRAATFSATTLQGGNLLSGNTDLYSIFLTTNDGNDITRIGQGTNIVTGGTANNPVVSVVPSPSFNSITASGASSFTTLTATTFISGSTDLSLIFVTHDQNTITNLQGGLNTYTGGTAIAPTINISAATLSYLSASTISGGTLLSGSTDLSLIFVTHDQNTITNVQGSSNIYTGGTATAPTINISAATLTSLSASTLSGGTLLSGATNLYSIFVTTDTNTVTFVQPGANTTTGGTSIAPTINIVQSPSFNGLSLSGTGIAIAFSATTLSGATHISGATDISSLFAHTGKVVRTVGQQGNIITAGTSTDVIIASVDSPNYNGLVLSGTGRAATFSATTLQGGTIQSGATNLYSIFVTNNTVTNVQPGTNTTTGGTATSPTINTVDSPSFAGIQLSGSGISARALGFSATTLSGGTLYSGNTALETIIFTPYSYSIGNQVVNSLQNFTLSGSQITVSATDLKVGSSMYTTICLSKIASGTVASNFYLKFGATGLSGDPTIANFSTGTGSAAIDSARVDIVTACRGPIGASCIFQTQFTLTHNLAATGFSILPCLNISSTSTNVSTTTGGTFSIALSGGTASSFTVSQCNTTTYYM